MYERVSRFPMVDSLPTCFLFIGITQWYQGPIYWHGRKVISFFWSETLTQAMQAMRAEFWSHFFFVQNSIHIVSPTFGPIPKLLIRIFTNFLTNQMKFDKSFLFTYFLLCFWTKTIWLVKTLWKFRIRSFGIGCWIRWARYWCLKMKRHYSIWILINRCVAVGVNIYVDGVINHMSGNDRTGNYIWIMNK